MRIESRDLDDETLGYKTQLHEPQSPNNAKTSKKKTSKNSC